MAYKVVFLNGDTSVGSAPWVDRDRAIAYAKQKFPTFQEELGATAVHVVDVMTSETIFVLPAAGDRPDQTSAGTTNL